QSTLDGSHKEVEDLHRKLLLLHKVVEPTADESTRSWENVQPDLSKKIDLAHLLETVQNKLQVAEDKYSRAESQLAEMRRRHGDEMKELDAKYSSSKRALLEQIDNNQVATNRTPTHLRKNSE